MSHKQQSKTRNGEEERSPVLDKPTCDEVEIEHDNGEQIQNEVRETDSDGEGDRFVMAKNLNHVVGWHKSKKYDLTGEIMYYSRWYSYL